MSFIVIIDQYLDMPEMSSWASASRLHYRSVLTILFKSTHCMSFISKLWYHIWIKSRKPMLRSPWPKMSFFGIFLQYIIFIFFNYLLSMTSPYTCYYRLKIRSFKIAERVIITDRHICQWITMLCKSYLHSLLKDVI